MRHKYYQHPALVRAPAQHDVLAQAPLAPQGVLQGFQVAPLDNTERFRVFLRIAPFPLLRIVGIVHLPTRFYQPETLAL